MEFINIYNFVKRFPINPLFGDNLSRSVKCSDEDFSSHHSSSEYDVGAGVIKSANLI